MHPNAFIEHLWQGSETDTVFVAMSFAPEYADRFEKVFRPAIQEVRYYGRPLTPARVDESKSGDSIISEILRGVCESRAVIADLSDMSPHQQDPTRNGNVMYELGLAHAVKSPAKVLVVRDDSKKLLFDVSSIPHYQIDFTDALAARKTITRLLVDRLKESESIEDIKLRAFVESISATELNVIVTLFKSTNAAPVDLSVPSGDKRVLPLPVTDALRRLCELGLVRSHVVQHPPPMKVSHSITERGKRACLALVRSLEPGPGET